MLLHTFSHSIYAVHTDSPINTRTLALCESPRSSLPTETMSNLPSEPEFEQAYKGKRALSHQAASQAIVARSTILSILADNLS